MVGGKLFIGKAVPPCGRRHKRPSCIELDEQRADAKCLSYVLDIETAIPQLKGDGLSPTFHMQAQVALQSEGAAWQIMCMAILACCTGRAIAAFLTPCCAMSAFDRRGGQTIGTCSPATANAMRGQVRAHACVSAATYENDHGDVACTDVLRCNMPRQL